MMVVSDEQVAALRAQLSGNLQEHLRLLDQIDPVAARTGYSALVAAAFCEAVEQRFAPDAGAADVIEFAGSVRSRSDDAADKIDPRVAERLILAVYTDEQVKDIPVEVRYKTQIILLGALIGDEQLDAAGLDAFLVRARKLADQWLA
jgi:hypothetical protein